MFREHLVALINLQIVQATSLEPLLSRTSHPQSQCNSLNWFLLVSRSDIKKTTQTPIYVKYPRDLPPGATLQHRNLGGKNETDPPSIVIVGTGIGKIDWWGDNEENPRGRSLNKARPNVWFRRWGPAVIISSIYLAIVFQSPTTGTCKKQPLEYSRGSCHFAVI